MNFQHIHTRCNTLLSLIFGVFLLSACDKERFGSEANVERRISLDDYKNVEINTATNVVLVQDTVCYVVAVGNSTEVIDLDFLQDNEELQISGHSTRKINPAAYIPRIECHFIDINSLKLNGNGSVISKDTLILDNLTIESKSNVASWNLLVNCDSLMVMLHAAHGLFEIAGRSNSAYIYTIGTNHLMCKNLVNNVLTVDHRGIGDVMVSVKNKLSALLYSQGNIYCYGEPENLFVKYEDLATGKLIIRP